MMESEYDGYIERLRQSSPAVFAFAQHLHINGGTVEIPAIRYAPNARRAGEFADACDLICHTKYDIKGLGIDFTCAADWKYGNEVFVAHVASVERAGNTIAYYVSLNAKLTHCAIITQKTRKHWHITEKVNKKYTGQMERYYACPLDLVIFQELLHYNGAR